MIEQMPILKLFTSYSTGFLLLRLQRFSPLAVIAIITLRCIMVLPYTKRDTEDKKTKKYATYGNGRDDAVLYVHACYIALLS